MTVYMVTMLCLTIAFNVSVAEDLILNDLFPVDRVLDVQITVDRKDWDTIRFQSRNFETEFQEKRMLQPIDSPYTYAVSYTHLRAHET